MNVFIICIIICTNPFISNLDNLDNLNNLDNNTPLQNKARVRLRLEYFNISGSEYLTIKLTGRLEKKYEPVKEMVISIFLMNQTESGLIGKVITDSDGLANFQLKEKYNLASDTLSEILFIAVLNTNPVFQDKETTLPIRKVNLETQFVDQDSLKLMHIYVAELDSSGNKSPQKNVEIKFFVDRPLSRLPIGDLYIATNEDGESDVYFPTDLAGDSSGNVKIFVRIDDSNIYGNVEISENLSWGVPTQFIDATVTRSLWASGANAPIILILLVSGLVAATWLILLYVVTKIFKISKI